MTFTLELVLLTSDKPGLVVVYSRLRDRIEAYFVTDLLIFQQDSKSVRGNDRPADKSREWAVARAPTPATVPAK